MINTLGKIIGTQNERELKRLRPLVGQINDLESGVTSCRIQTFGPGLKPSKRV